MVEDKKKCKVKNSRTKRRLSVIFLNFLKYSLFVLLNNAEL